MFSNFESRQAEKELAEMARRDNWWLTIKEELPAVSLDQAIARERDKWRKLDGDTFSKIVSATREALARNSEQHGELVSDYEANELAESEWFLRSSATHDKGFLLKSKNRFAKIRESLREDMKTNLLVAQGLRARLAALEPEVVSRKRAQETVEKQILRAYGEARLRQCQTELAHLQIKMAALTSFTVGQSHEWTNLSGMSEAALSRTFGGKQSLLEINTAYHKQLRDVVLAGGNGDALPMPRQKVDYSDITQKAFYTDDDLQAAFEGSTKAKAPVVEAETESLSAPEIVDVDDDDHEIEIIEFSEE